MLVGVVNRFVAGSAVAALAFYGSVYAVDGVAPKQAVDAWASAPTAFTQSAYFAVAEGIRRLEWGVRSYSDYISGLSLVWFATVITWTARIPRPIGYIMGLSGLATIARGYLYGTVSCDAVCAPISATELLSSLPIAGEWVLFESRV